MATIPYFVLSPSTILSLSGILRGQRRDAHIDVVIPALNEAENIVLCLASVLHQIVRPRWILTASSLTAIQRRGRDSGESRRIFG